ncbi:hypothetical protein PB1_16984 [Bacillus methanolicus PB1]|uniref:DUF2953 domain-containing protein n=1 Tax=Bacillus methanolicus PB1 TaxID=997296 RepID=I3DYF1_BACMT|nr:DUF2953 domain-containing protein [Bacillus methanolicus]EIJ79272.1 hypothetical protein PB1_16984 [Bacillus methanolicus PB1]
MKWLVIALAVLLLLLIIVFVTKLTIYVNYDHVQDNDHLKLEFRAWLGLIRYKLKIPLIKIDENSPTVVLKEEKQMGNEKKPSKEEAKQYSAEDLLNSLKDTKEILTHVIGLHKIIRKFLKKVTIKQFEWFSVAGIGDAAYTGILIGALWAVKGSIVGIISHNMKLKVIPKIIITPNFQRAISKTTLRCMFQFRIGHAMLAGIKLVKYWKGGKPKFRSKALSVFSDDKTKSV